MKNNWKPTRVIKEDNDFRINTSEVGYGSYYVFSIQLNIYVDIIKKHAAGDLLDCGCGKVPYYEIYKDQVDNIVCTDWENTYNTSSSIDVHSNLNEKLNVDSNSFRTVLVTDVINHIHQPKVLMKEVTRVLRQNGKLILTTPFYYWINEAPYDYHRYTKFELIELCKENNLKIIELKEYGGFLDIIFDMGNKIIPNRKWMINSYLKITKFLSKTFIHRKLSKYNERFPLGYYLIAEKC